MKLNPLVIAFGLIPLVGCGGGSSSDTTSDETSTYSVKAIDGYLRNAQVWLDIDGDYQLDNDEPSALSGEGGATTLDVTGIDTPEQYKVVVQAVAGQTIDEDTITDTNTDGTTITTDYMMSAPAGETVVTPLSTLVDIVMEENDIELETAVTQVATDLDIEEETLLDDYIADDAGDTAAKASSIVALDILPDSEDEMSDLTDGDTNTGSINDELTDDIATELSTLEEDELLVADEDSSTGVTTVAIVDEDDEEYDEDADGADKDDDGVINLLDAFPEDATEWSDFDEDGTGDNSDEDDDGDEVADSEDAFPYNASETTDTDGDLIGNNADTDDDGDGIADSEDAFPLDNAETTDTDEDGTGNNADTDDDGDGTIDSDDAFPLDGTETTDTDGDGTGDNTDTDDDDDGTIDSDDAFPLDGTETTDTDGDGIGDNADTDDDDDGTIDSDDAFPLNDTETTDTDGDGTGDNADTDDDDDGTIDSDDAFPLDDSETTDTDGDGTGNNADTDDDDDGILDVDETETISIIGTWSNTGDIFTFNADGTYSHTDLNDNDECSGVETGTYTYDETTGDLTPTSVISNGDGYCGFYSDDGEISDFESLTFTPAESGNYITLAFEEYEDEGLVSGLIDFYKSQGTTAAEYIAANSNFFFPSIELEDDEIEIEYSDTVWNSSDYSVAGIDYYYDFDTQNFLENPDDDEDYILTNNGWMLINNDNDDDATLTPQDNGSMVYSNSYQNFILTGEEWLLSNSNIKQFSDSIGINEELLDYFDEDATFSEGASLLVMAEEYTSNTYSVWLDTCDEDSDYQEVQVADTGLCNRTWTTSDGSPAQSIDDITATITFAQEEDQSWGNFNGIYMEDYVIRLVDNDAQTVDVYSMDWQNDSITLVSEDVTWSEVTLYGEVLYTFSTDDDDLSELNEQFLTVIVDEEGTDYLRIGDIWGNNDDAEIMFNNTAKDDIFDAFIENITVSTLEATIEDGEAVLKSIFSDYDGDSETSNKLYADADAPTQISTDIKLNNISVPTDGNVRTHIKLVYINETTGDEDQTDDFSAYLQIRVYENETVIRPFVEFCNDSECDDSDMLYPDDSDTSNTMTWGKVIDTPTDFVNLGIECSAATESCIFTYVVDDETYTATISLAERFEILGYDIYDYAADGASIRTKFGNQSEGESFSVTAYLDNVFIDNNEYDSFSLGSLDTGLWWSSANNDQALITCSLLTFQSQPLCWLFCINYK